MPYGFDKKQKDPYAMKTWFTNLFNPPQKIIWLVCPSYQVIIARKIVVIYNILITKNALHSSRD